MTRRLLFVLAILASSFLIFLVQPMVGKRILPWFGGTPSVWTVCLAFYQTTLFLGYAYAHLLIRFASPVSQIGIHAVLVGAAFLALPVLPDNALRAVDVTNPSLDILTMLSSSVALPFIALASTGPLVQAWFARSYPDRSPYPLYAVSNIGSFAALLAYPFFLEPRLPLSTTGTLWSFAFAVTGLAVLGCALIARTAVPDRISEDVPESIADSERISATRVLVWIGLSGTAVIVLMGVTNSVCLDVASVPFLWVLPLATYLMTFILCFAAESNYKRVPYILLTIGAFFLTLGFPLTYQYVLLLLDDPARANLVLSAVYVVIPAYCALLFGSCMILHGELYRLRPPPQRLTTFYLCVSGGGALGGLSVGLLAPILFSDYYEIRVGIALTLVLFIAANALTAKPSGLAGLRGWRWRLAAPASIALCFYALLPPPIDHDSVVHMERGFFGVLQVKNLGVGDSLQRHLISGSTLHGLEFVIEGTKPPLPSSYYGRATGIAGVFAHRDGGPPIHAGLIGLGVGTLSSYGRRGDVFRYYEIDPAVAYIARDSGLFSFLDRSRAQVEIVIADARLALDGEQQEAGSQQYDLLVLDAFNSDAIPVHLLTVEAFRIYKNALSEDGLLAVHVSNRHFDLGQLVARAGFEVGLQPLVVDTALAPEFQSQAANWILLSPSLNLLGELHRSLRKRLMAQQLPMNSMKLRRPRLVELQDVPLWSDDYSDLLSALRAR